METRGKDREIGDRDREEEALKKKSELNTGLLCLFAMT